MIDTKFYDKFFPEPGIKYYVDEDSAVLVWEGFFYELFVHITENFIYDDYPIEFKEYNDLTGWRDDSSPRKIDLVDTITKIGNSTQKEYRKEYLECFQTVITFLKKNIDKDVYIVEYL